VSLTEMPRSSVIRFDNSAEMSHSVAGGTSPVFDQATVGKDIWSATQGSSVASVAGKKRDPTKQCASAWAVDSATTRHASANAREQLETQSMTILHLARERQNGRLRPSVFTTPAEGLASGER
jgi:hypothetical protein